MGRHRMLEDLFSNTAFLWILVLLLFAMQSLGGLKQGKDFQKAMSRVHKYGNVGAGQRRGKFFNGYIVLIACDSKRVITYAEILDGVTIFSKFHPTTEFLGKVMVGRTIDEFLTELRAMDEKKQKKYVGYLNALEALETRLNKEAEAALEDDDEDEEDELDLSTMEASTSTEA